MLKKIGIVTALSSAIIFGGTFHNTADAAAKTDYVQKYIYKVSYPIPLNNLSFNQLNDLFEQILNANFWDKKWDVQLGTDHNQNGQVNDNGAQHNEQHSADQNTMEHNNGNINVNDHHANENNHQSSRPDNGQTDQSTVNPPKQDQPEYNWDTPVQKPEQNPGQNLEQKPELKPEQQKPEQKPEQQPETKPSNPSGSQSSSVLSQFEQQVVELTNKERTSRGLSALQVDMTLSKSAHEKSRDMSARNYFSHTSPTYGSPFDMMKSYGITYRTAGENIAKGQKTPEEVVNAWMNSAGHRANILNPNFTHIGVGYVSNENYWTQQFIGK